MMGDDMFSEHELKCRICMRVLKNSQELLIKKFIRSQFQIFTGIELKKSQCYSNKICKLCDYEIRRIMKFRETISIRQMRLYELYPELSEEGNHNQAVNEIIIPDDDELVIKEEQQDPIPIIESIHPMGSFVNKYDERGPRAPYKKVKKQNAKNTENINNVNGDANVTADVCKSPPKILRTYSRPRRPQPIVVKSEVVESVPIHTKTQNAHNYDNIDIKDEDEDMKNCMIASQTLQINQFCNSILKLSSVYRDREPSPVQNRLIIIDSDGDEIPYMTKVESIFLESNVKTAKEIELKTENDEEQNVADCVEITNSRANSSMTISKVYLKRKEWPKYHCDLCPYTCCSSKLDHMRRHMEIRHTEKAQLLKKEKQNIKNMKRKAKRAEKVKIRKTYTCDYCGKVCHNKRGLKIHLLHEVTKKDRSICDLCGADFQSRHHLSGHQYRVHRAKTIRHCDFCMEGFDEKKKLMYHMRRVHKYLQLQPRFLCQFCSKTFFERRSLIKHLRTHPDKPIEFVHCPICHGKFKKWRIDYHIQTFHKGMRFTCVYHGCNTLITQKKDVIGHIKVVHHVTDKDELDVYRNRIKDLKAVYLSEEQRKAFPKFRNKRKPKKPKTGERN